MTSAAGASPRPQPCARASFATFGRRMLAGPIGPCSIAAATMTGHLARHRGRRPIQPSRDAPQRLTRGDAPSRSPRVLTTSGAAAIAPARPLLVAANAGLLVQSRTPSAAPPVVTARTARPPRAAPPTAPVPEPITVPRSLLDRNPDSIEVALRASPEASGQYACVSHSRNWRVDESGDAMAEEQKYFAADAEFQDELSRLRLIEELSDPTTIRHLVALDVVLDGGVWRSVREVGPSPAG